MEPHCSDVDHGGPLQSGEYLRLIGGRQVMEVCLSEVGHGGPQREVESWRLIGERWVMEARWREVEVGLRGPPGFRPLTC